jgi:uncharacterized protein with GYD domain
MSLGGTSGQRFFPREGHMPKFVMLVNWTDRGAEDLETTLGRTDRAAQAFKDDGAGQVLEIYLTMGEWDEVLVLEADNAKSAAALALALSDEGRLHTRTLPAFDRGEVKEIAASSAKFGGGKFGGG